MKAVRDSVIEEDHELMNGWKNNLPIIYSLLLQERDRREQAEVITAVKEFNGIITVTLDGEEILDKSCTVTQD